jgi:hypothetical protein
MIPLVVLATLAWGPLVEVTLADGPELTDAGFEGIAGTAPDTNSFPWFTVGEGQDGSFVTETNQAHGGSQSVRFTFYFDEGAIVQNLGLRVDETNDYVASIWMRTAEPSGNAAHTNAPALNGSLYTSPVEGGPYSFRSGFFWNRTNQVEDAWEQASGVLRGPALAACAGEYMQIRYLKANPNSTHRIWIDDACLEVAPAAGAVVSIDPAAEQHPVTTMALGAGLVYPWHGDAMFADGEVAHIIQDIAIISLLASLLVPAVQSALGRARSIACTSNLRQIYTSQVLYANVLTLAGNVIPVGVGELDKDFAIIQP